MESSNSEKKHKRGRKADKRECKGVVQSSERSRRKPREHSIMKAKGRKYFKKSLIKMLLRRPER